MKFNYAAESENSNPSPEYQTPYGAPKPPLQARGNVRYRKTIDLIQYMWDRGNPEIDFVPYKENHIYDPEKGYIVYSLIRARPVDSMPKARFHESVDNQTDPDQVTTIWIQSFYYAVKFTAIHKDPIVAEEMIENFEDSMFYFIPELLRCGVEQVQYGERPADETKTRYGDDLSARSVMYNFKIQKMAFIEQARLKEIIGQVQAFSEAEYNQYGLPRKTEGVNILPKDFYTGATPST